MKKWIGPIFTAAALGIVSHATVLHYAPELIMGRAMALIEQRGTPLHGFNLGPQMTPKTQTVVRPSPDLAYSACRFDLSQAPNGLKVGMAAYDNYSSMSFFDAQTNNFLTIRGDGESREVTLLPPGSTAGGEGSTVAPSDKGVILIRRLAPNKEAYQKVVAVAGGDICQTI